MTNPEQLARIEIDRLLTAAGWAVQDVKAADIHAALGVALREFPLNPGHGKADYLLYIDGKAAGVVEAKKQGATLKGVELQSAKYSAGLPATLPAWTRPLPFLYESTGVETQFTNGLDPEPRSRAAFAFHRPELLADWLKDLQAAALATGEVQPLVAQKPANTFALAVAQHPLNRRPVRPCGPVSTTQHGGHHPDPSAPISSRGPRGHAYHVRARARGVACPVEVPRRAQPR